ncbi:gamma-butyrolactone biosynthesis enzyme [Streptomyces sp. LP05-1]|uniref:Gamma-butyrolactone biosynthesis enzyme n=1 Tax=Streptomyces pyxinae TaxID=2970734 RepID=A0ABT2CHM7_9ACTN|nr:gamma-butyrolactone biosynthesis enzyme [Streptomyces sp. LP05-1]
MHRAAVAEVFLTDWHRLDRDTFSIGAQWPRGHSLYRPRAGQQDPMLLAESIRQAGALLAHTQYGVPLGHHFLMWSLSYDVVPGGLVADLSPTEIELLTTCDEITMRGRHLASLRYSVTAFRDRLPVATGEAAFSCASPAAYDRLRGDRRHASSGALPAPVSPDTVGRESSRDVVLSRQDARRPRQWQLRVEPTHPIYFDHPVDHVPGMVLLEAARQAALALARPGSPVPFRMSGTFRRYAELGTECRIRARADRTDPAGHTVVQVTGEQAGHTVFTCAVGTRPAH